MSATMQELDRPTVNITEAALSQIKFLKQKKGDDRLALRIGVKGGGCSGLSYVMNLEESPTERDLIYTFGDLQVFVDPKSARFLDGITLDYSVKNLLEGGWKWVNPNAARSCGCGTSFTPK